MFKKRFFSILLTLILLFSFTGTAFASPVEKKDSIYSKMLLALYSLDIETYGFNGIDFRQIKVGNAVSSYEYANNSLNSSNYTLYPLTYEGKLIAFAIKNYGTENIQITTDLVDEISANIDINNSFALMYDKNSCYAYTDGNLRTLHNTAVSVENRQDLNNISNSAFFKNVECNSYAPVQSLDNYFESDLSDVSSTTVIDKTLTSELISSIQATTSAYCYVSFILQNPPSEICWACTVASIGNYVKSQNYTGIYVAQSVFGSDYNHGLSANSAVATLNSLYSLNYTYKSSVPSSVTILQKLVNAKPIYGSWTWSSSGSSGRHATVIYGINTVTNVLSLMDPEYGFEQAVASGSSFVFTSLYSGVTCTLDGYGAPN